MCSCTIGTIVCEKRKERQNFFLKDSVILPVHGGGKYACQFYFQFRLHFTMAGSEGGWADDFACCPASFWQRFRGTFFGDAFVAPCYTIAPGGCAISLCLACLVQANQQSRGHDASPPHVDARHIRAAVSTRRCRVGAGRGSMGCGHPRYALKLPL